eukprot:5153824-Pyramimonas_sp.AAC.1
MDQGLIDVRRPPSLPGQLQLGADIARREAELPGGAFYMGTLRCHSEYAVGSLILILMSAQQSGQ